MAEGVQSCESVCPEHLRGSASSDALAGQVADALGVGAGGFGSSDLRFQRQLEV